MARDPEWTVLKTDLFGRVERGHCSRDGARIPCVRRDTRAGRWWLRWLARRLAAREARALRALEGVPGCPRLIAWERGVLLRTWLDGTPLAEVERPHPAWHEDARRRLVRLHRRGVAHNDLAKENNLLVLGDGSPAFVDFQLASVHAHRTRAFRTLAREDLRHLLKHKRTRHAARLTARERSLLARPSRGARLWRRAVKPVYHFVTRRLFRWADREGRADRQFPAR